MTEFFEVISQSGPHIYHSALQLAPQLSIVQKLYGQQIYSPMVRVVTGIPSSWDLCTASAEIIGGGDNCTAWSPCGQFVAVSSRIRIQLRDSNTLERVSVLEPPHNLRDYLPISLTFSPSGHLLACFYKKQKNCSLTIPACASTPISSISSPITLLIVWDTQTGIVIGEVNTQHRGGIMFHGDKGTITPIPWGHHFDTYNSLSLGLQYKGEIPSPPDSQLGAYWTHEDTLQFATSFKTDEKSVINIYKLQPALTPPLCMLSSFPVPPQSGEFSFSPISFHASFVTLTEVVVLDVQDSKLLLAKMAQGYNSGQFSHDGCFFACGVLMHEICVWQNTPTGYVPWSSLRPRLPFQGFSWSPTSISILCWDKQGIQLLHPDNHLSPNKPQLHDGYLNHLVVCSTDGTHLVTAQQDGKTVTVLDRLLDSPHHFISTNMKNQDTSVSNNATFVVDMHKFIGWDLEAGRIVQGSHDGSKAVVNEILVTDSDMEQLASSHNRSQIAFTTKQGFFLYHVKTQKAICGSLGHQLNDAKFPLYGHQVWSIGVDPSSHIITLVTGPPEPRVESYYSLSNHSLQGNFQDCGHSSEWVMGFKRKILWLPPAWRKELWYRLRRESNFLASLSHHQEPIVIKFYNPSPSPEHFFFTLNNSSGSSIY